MRAGFTLDNTTERMFENKQIHKTGWCGCKAAFQEEKQVDMMKGRSVFYADHPDTFTSFQWVSKFQQWSQLRFR